MDVRSVLVALVGVAVAGGSALGAKQYMLTQSAAPVAAVASAPAIEIVNVVVATQDIGYGQAVEAQMLRYQPWPRVAMPQGAFTQMEQLLGGPDERPRRLKFPIAQGEIVLASKVSGFGEKVTLVQDLGLDRRAMAIKVDAVTAVGGFVTPGDMVDVLLTQGSGDEMRAMTILQAARVLGVDQETDTQNEQPGVARTVTVEVSPEDSQKLALAQKAGTLSLTLRRLDSDKNGPLDYTSLQDLLQDESPVPTPVAKQTVKVRRGTETEVIELSN